MFKIDISVKGNNSEINTILIANGFVVSGNIQLPFVIESDKYRAIILAGEVNNYFGNFVDIKIAAKLLIVNQAKETDFHGGFICVELSKNYINIYTDPFGQFPIYYKVNSGGSISLSSGEMCRKLSSVNPNIDVNFILNYIESGNYLQGKTAIDEVKLLSPGFKYCFSLDGLLTREYVINGILSKAEVASPYDILKNSIKQKLSCYGKLILELSGGVESSSIAAILAFHKKDKDIRFLTYFDRFSLSSNELKFAKRVSTYFNVKLDVIELSDRPPFTPFTEEIPFHVLPSSYSCLYNQQHYIADLYDKNTLFINGHGGDSIYLAPSPPALFIEILLNAGVKNAIKTLYGIALQHHSSIPFEIKQSLKNNYLSNNSADAWYFHSVKNLSKYTRPATIFWWQTLGATISETLPVLNSSFSGKAVYYPFLSSPVIINVLKTGLDKLVRNEFNRYPLRKSVYLNSGYNGIWRTDKGDTTHNMLDGFNKNYNFVRDFILGGYIADKKIIDIKCAEKVLRKLYLGLPDGLPAIVRLYSAEACIRSINTGVL
ncbi:asparagine synthase-related protein [Klebsiella variicola]|uniref:asparagine synthase-related protein n=2 Tax=Klebsiella variicola TaxID=244366 RepID=UPI00188FCF71|nr:asparagine synthase-related protein [Klebsiella variicola]EMD1678286.1 hypothetical protein [Klebsiella variicola]